MYIRKEPTQAGRHAYGEKSKDPLELEVLLRLYEDDREFARHHENQRTQGSGLIVAIAAGITTLGITG